MRPEKGTRLAPVCAARVSVPACTIRVQRLCRRSLLLGLTQRLPDRRPLAKRSIDSVTDAGSSRVWRNWVPTGARLRFAAATAVGFEPTRNFAWVSPTAVRTGADGGGG